jgi:hypothetical protein
MNCSPHVSNYILFSNSPLFTTSVRPKRRGFTGFIPDSPLLNHHCTDILIYRPYVEQTTPLKLGHWDTGTLGHWDTDAVHDQMYVFERDSLYYYRTEPRVRGIS